ncbi:MAG TPA: hypothetical protein VN649_14470 [Ramlibacter sp.]|nr:hypothetical protein [Ramlibacter sp.]
MLRKYLRAVFAAGVTAMLVSCGGGTMSDDVLANGPAPTPRAAAAAASPPVKALAAARAVDATGLMDWAERAYPQFFPSHQPNQVFGPYVYRYYGSGVYLGLEGQTVVVLGLLGPGIVPVGTIADFACNVYPENCPVLSGVAAKGLLNSASVAVFNMNGDGSKGGLLASGSTAADGTGRFSVVLPAQPAGPVLLEVSGGSYSSAYDGSTIASQSKMSAMLRSVSASGEANVSVNPLTDMTTALTRSYIAERNTLAASLDTAEMWVGAQFGLKTAASRIIPKFDVSAAQTDPEGVHLALVLGALDTLGKRLSPANPDAIFASLTQDFSDGVFDGRTLSQQVMLNGAALTAGAGTSEFLKAFAVTFSGTSAGWRPRYLDAHFSAGTVVEKYEAKIIPVYVASDIKAYFPPTWTSPLPKTTSLDASATGYSCPSTAVTFDASGHGSCGSYYSCSGSATLVNVNGYTGCSDGSIAVYHAASIAVYKAPSIVPYSASTMQPYVAATTIGVPSAGAIPIFRATAVHVLTQAERDAMMANDRAAGDAAAARVSALGVPTALQLEWLGRINDAVIASVSH